MYRLSWLPKNMHVRHLVFSGSLAYDIIVQLNLTHRHLIDRWPSQDHYSIATDDVDDDGADEQSAFFEDNEESESLTEHAMDVNHHQYTRLLTDLTFKLRERSKQIKTFSLALSGELASISILYLDHNLLKSIPSQALYNATGLYEIYLSFNHIVRLPAFAFGFSHRLTRLDVSHNEIASIDDLTFQRHPNAFAGPFLIDYLDLSHNQLTVLQPNMFAYLVNLRLLKLQHNQIHTVSALVWTGLYRLKYLDLSHNYLDNFTQAFYSSYLNELTHLKLTSNNISQLEPCEFLSLKALNKLSLSRSIVTRPNVRSFSFYFIR